MNLKDQVLTINQVQELQELGFDVSKYATLYWASCDGCSSANCFERQILELNISKSKCCVNQTNIIPTLTIGDIIEILPKEIDFKFGIIWIMTIQFLNNKYQVFYSYEKQIARVYSDKKYINALFETLKWCIQNKHIEL